MTPRSPSMTLVPQPATRRDGGNGGGRSKLTVIVADDHPLVREALLRTLSEDGRFEVVGQAVDGRDAVALAEELAPDLAVLDVRMPVLDGLQAMEAIADHVPRTRVVLLSAFDDIVVKRSAMASGAAGYLTKDTERDVICDALARVGRGERITGADGRDEAEPSSAQTPELGLRERNVMLLYSQEWSDKMIGMLLGIPVDEVGWYMQRAVTKLGAYDRASAVDAARALGLLP